MESKYMTLEKMGNGLTILVIRVDQLADTV